VHHLVHPGRVRRGPVADGWPGGLLQRERTLVHQPARHRHIGLVVVAPKGQTHHLGLALRVAFVLQADATGALHLDQQHVQRVSEVDQFASGQCGAALWCALQLVAAEEGLAGAQPLRGPVQRVAKTRIRGTSAFQQWLEVAGQQAGGAAIGGAHPPGLQTALHPLAYEAVLDLLAPLRPQLADLGAHLCPGGGRFHAALPQGGPPFPDAVLLPAGQLVPVRRGPGGLGALPSQGRRARAAGRHLRRRHRRGGLPGGGGQQAAPHQAAYNQSR